MKTSPFPGMDPWLESRWPEVHARLIVYSSNQINRTLPDDLQANIEESLTVHASDQDSRGIRPDVHVTEDLFSNGAGGAATATSTAETIAEPLLMKRPPHPSRHVEIVDKDGRIITAIEILSPWNKVGSRNREQYTRKQLDYMAAGVNLVEIDLIRQGAYVLAAPLEDFQPGQRTPYLVCVYRDILPDQIEVYRAPLQDPLPNIPIPLRPHEKDIVLDLQALLNDCYRDGRYHRIDYTTAPRGTFDEVNTAWIDAQLRANGKRS